MYSFSMNVNHNGSMVSLMAAPPFVNVTGPKTGMMFTATGTGTVAGFPNVAVEALGDFMSSGSMWSISFRYNRGVNGELPGGMSSDYDCDGSRVGP